LEVIVGGSGRGSVRTLRAESSGHRLHVRAPADYRKPTVNYVEHRTAVGQFQSVAEASKLATEALNSAAALKEQAAPTKK